MVDMLYCVKFFITFAVILSVKCFSEEIPCTSSELPCDNGGCIGRRQWCDSKPDCRDNSDEMYCASSRNPRPNCLEHHFRCEYGTCMPMNVRCDGYPDCLDESDEFPKICDKRKISGSENFSGDKRNLSSDPILTTVIERAQKWISSRRDENYGWDADTARAVVALYLVDRQRYEGTMEGDLMKKQLNIEIAVDIVKNTTEPISLSELAIHVNSLIATCQNPKAFEGQDLTYNLRIRADQQMRLNTTVTPLVFLTLCLTGEFRNEDFVYLYHYFLKMHDQQKIDLQAVALMAVACLSQRKSHRINEKSSDEKLTESFAQRLAERFQANGQEANVYTSALVIQGLNAARFEQWDKVSAVQRLTKFQQNNGSFGDLLATYLALPAIAGKSLLSLKDVTCDKDPPHNRNSALLPPHEGYKEIHYSLWFGNPVEGSHTISLKIGGNWTMFEVMKHAADQSEVFRFHYEETSSGPSVYSIANVPNDIEREFQWNLYRRSQHSSSEHYSDRNLSPFDLGGKPDRGDKVIMWYKTTDAKKAQ